MKMLILATAVSFLVTLGITPAVMALALKLRLVDDPNKREHPANTHLKVLPRAGGLSILLGILVASLIFLTMGKIIFGILLGAILIVILGLIDDYIDVSPYLRFASNILIVCFVIFFGLGTPYITSPFGGVIRLDTIKLSYDFFGTHQFLLLANLFSIIWIVALMNFVNWSKGVDGQLPGFVAISAFVIGIIALRFSVHDIKSLEVAMFAYIVGGAFCGFLIWNFYPQKILPGYSGGALAGYFLGVLSILSFAKIGTLALVLSIPLVDAVYTILRRIRMGRSPFYGDALHFHHRLLAIGWGRRRIAIFYWLVSLLFGVSALFFAGIQKLLALLIVFCLLAVFLLVSQRLSVTHDLESEPAT